jgi:hypothetical protein
MRFWAIFNVTLMTAAFSVTYADLPAFGAASDGQSCVVNELADVLFGPTDEERQVLAEVKGNLRKLKPLSEKESKTLNAAAIDALKASPIAKPSKTSKRKGTFSVQEIQRLYDDVVNRPEVKKTLCGGFHQGGYINSEGGFCFAKAMAVHFEALQSGAVNGNIRKIWVIGKLRSQGREYKYHVATTVRADDGSWYVIDPDVSGPLLLDEWHNRIRGWNTDGKMRLFFTQAKRLLPATDAKYSKEIFESGTEFYVDFLDEIYKENTGHAGPWSKIRSDRKRARLIQKALLMLGVGGAVGGIEYYFAPLKPSSVLQPPRSPKSE